MGLSGRAVSLPVSVMSERTGSVPSRRVWAETTRASLRLWLSAGGSRPAQPPLPESRLEQARLAA